MQELSLNEYSTLCKRAARGAGMEWGDAETFAKLSAWLIKHGSEPTINLKSEDIVSYSVEFLLKLKQNPESYTAPPIEKIENIKNGILSFQQGQLNPIRMTSVIEDFDLLGKSLHINNIAYPLLLLPVVYWYIDKLEIKQWFATERANIQLDTQQPNLTLSSSTNSRVILCDNDLKQLEQLSLQICVPESELSLKDAG